MALLPERSAWMEHQTSRQPLLPTGGVGSAWAALFQQRDTVVLQAAGLLVWGGMHEVFEDC